MRRIWTYRHVYDDDLAEVVDDVDKRLDRLELAVRALATEPGQPHHAADIALKFLEQEY